MNAIAIADPHTICREALCEYIRQAGQDMTIFECGDYESLWECIRAESLELVLIDLSLPGAEPLNIARDFAAMDVPVKLGAIVPDADGMEKLGPVFHGVFPKSLSSKAFLSGIQDILAGREFFPDISAISKITFERPAVKKPLQDFNLTPREREVLGYLVKGASNKDIARALDLQVVTVKLHVRGICRKTSAANRTQAAITAKENGWA